MLNPRRLALAVAPFILWLLVALPALAAAGDLTWAAQIDLPTARSVLRATVYSSNRRC